jgi:23S rRNA (cytosine1962-C5)-methyltransferase
MKHNQVRQSIYRKNPEIARAVTSETALSGTAIINRRAANRVLAGHPWIYVSDVEEIVPENAPEVKPGALVVVTDARGLRLGTAMYSSTSQIALRMVSREDIKDRVQFLDLIREQVRRAVRMRMERLGQNAETNACRLIFSEADELPGVLADKYGELLILQLLTQGTCQGDVRRVIVRTLLEMLPVESILERPDARIRELEQLPQPVETVVYASEPANPKATTFFALNGLRFYFDANAGQKTGAFLDQRENYIAAAAHAHGRALDICTYQGGFALHLARRCEQVTGVDVSRMALETAEKNLQENRDRLLEQGRGVEWIEANAFELLRDWSDAGEEFDTIVLDPPAFAKSKRAAESAWRGYKEMNLRALKMLRPGGVLVTCSCSHHVGLQEFQAAVAAAAADAGRRVQLLEMRGAAWDHPAILTIPETQYLKCLICRVE